MQAWFVYILECADGTLYTGCTTDVERRLRQHNGDLVGGPKYTCHRRPCVIAATFPAVGRGEAQSMESAVQAAPRAAKLALIHGTALLAKKCSGTSGYRVAYIRQHKEVTK